MQNNRKLRMTQQRSVILEELQKVRSHPTADEVYEMVRKRLPRVSLGTVYRNLEILFEAGMIGKLAGTPMRFDYDINDHHHIRCISCSRVDDVHIDDQIVDDKIKGVSDWQIVGHQIEMLGICPDCKNKKQ